jgi:aromatic ring-opening dioxygenase catalytic subunit (LigB family)
MDPRGGPPPAWARDFDDWLGDALEGHRLDDLLDWDKKAPHAQRAHPSPEHFLPLFVALGAAGFGAFSGEVDTGSPQKTRPNQKPADARRIHRGFTLGGLSMSAFRFAA